MNKEEFTKYLDKAFPHKSSFFSGFSLFCVDILSMLFCFLLSFFVVNLFWPQDINFKSFINFAVYLPFILIIFGCVGLYPGIMISPTEEIKKIAMCCFFSFSGISITLLLAELIGIDFTSIYLIKDSKPWAICTAFLLNVPVSTFLIPGFRETGRHFFSRFSWWGVPAVIYCNGESAIPVINRLVRNRYLGYKPAVVIDASRNFDSFTGHDIPVLHPKSDYLEIVNNSGIKVAFICNYKQDIATIVRHYRYTITVFKHQLNFSNSHHLKDIAGIIGYSSVQNLTFKTNLLIKRFLDLFIVFLFSPLWLPVFLILCILTKCTSKGPVFYGHRRVGKNGREFKCWKFRSMRIDSQEMLEHILATDPVRRAEWEKDCKFTDDPRVTRFGKILRKTSLDELPQLINVLTGEMSLIGPRPVTEPELVKYGEYRDFVLSATPGLSGMWQVSGRSDTGYEERVSLDTFYIQNWSIWLDLWILIKTIWVVLKGKGAY